MIIVKIGSVDFPVMIGRLFISRMVNWLKLDSSSTHA